MSEPTQLWQLGAAAAARGLRAGDFSATELLENVLQRVDELNPQLNAIVEDRRDDGRARAAELDQRSAAGDWQGPLHGLPVTIKINVDLAGSATSNGLPALADAIAQEDSPIVSNLRRGGAVIFGRNNAPELSMRACTDNPLHGRTHNPWSEQASPGGSSGGAGSAAAAGFGPIHHGNDIGGSLRFPSYCCGVSSVKPTLGRVPAFNPSATAERGLLAQLMSVQGVICRHAEDLRLAMPVIARGDARDPWWTPAPFDTWPDDGRPVIGMTRETYGYAAHDEVLAGLERAAEALQDAGYQVEEIDTPDMSLPAQAWLQVAVYELRETLADVIDNHCSESLQQIFDWLYELGPVAGIGDYLPGMAKRTSYTRAWNETLARYPLILTPYLMRPVYDYDYDAQSPENLADLFSSACYSTGVNFLSLPAGVFPTGLAAGRPTGVQLVGQRFREDLIIDAMQAVEERLGVLSHELWRR